MKLAKSMFVGALVLGGLFAVTSPARRISGTIVMSCVRTEGNSIGTGESTGVIYATVPADASLPVIGARSGRTAGN